MTDDFMPKRIPKVLRVDWDKKHQSGFQVLGGFHIRRYGPNRLGFKLSCFGVTTAVFLWSFRPRDWLISMKTCGVFQDNRAAEPPFKNVKLSLGPLRVMIGPAYSGLLKSND